MGELEDRCIRVFVDGDDEARILDAQFVLDSTGNAQGDVNLRSNFLARNADLPFIRRPFFIDEGFGNAESCADALGKGLDRFHAVFGLDTAAGTDDDISRRDSQFFRFFSTGSKPVTVTDGATPVKSTLSLTISPVRDGSAGVPWKILSLIVASCGRVVVWILTKSLPV